MAKEWTDDEVQSAIAEAVRIVREDKFETFIRGRLGNSSNDKNDPNDGSGNSGDGNKDNGGEGNPPPKKRGLWWGDQ